MHPVRTEDCNIVYRGPDGHPEIGDLWCHRVRPGVIRVTFEPDDIELELLKTGGRVQLTMMREPIAPIMMEVMDKDVTEPIGPHGWKITETPPFSKPDKEVVDGDDNEQQPIHEAAATEEEGETADAGDSRAQSNGQPLEEAAQLGRDGPDRGHGEHSTDAGAE